MEGPSMEQTERVLSKGGGVNQENSVKSAKHAKRPEREIYRPPRANASPAGAAAGHVDVIMVTAAAGERKNRPAQSAAAYESTWKPAETETVAPAAEAEVDEKVVRNRKKKANRRNAERRERSNSKSRGQFNGGQQKRVVAKRQQVDNKERDFGNCAAAGPGRDGDSNLYGARLIREEIETPESFRLAAAAAAAVPDSRRHSSGRGRQRQSTGRSKGNNKKPSESKGGFDRAAILENRRNSNGKSSNFNDALFRPAVPEETAQTYVRNDGGLTKPRTSMVFVRSKRRQSNEIHSASTKNGENGRKPAGIVQQPRPQERIGAVEEAGISIGAQETLNELVKEHERHGPMDWSLEVEESLRPGSHHDEDELSRQSGHNDEGSMCFPVVPRGRGSGRPARSRGAPRRDRVPMRSTNRRMLTSARQSETSSSHSSEPPPSTSQAVRRGAQQALRSRGRVLAPRLQRLAEERGHTGTGPTDAFEDKNERATSRREEGSADGGGKTKNAVQQWLAGPAAGQLTQGEEEICNIVQHCGPNMAVNSPEKLDRLTQLCLDMARLYVHAISLDVEFSYRKDMETNMWRKYFYRPIEYFRSCLVEIPDHALLLDKFNQFLNKSEQFYEEQLGICESRFGICRNDVLYWGAEEDLQPTKDLARCVRPIGSAGGGGVQKGRSFKVAVLSCQRFALALGDLNRYLKQNSRVPEKIKRYYRNAKRWYNFGIQLAPTNGHLYNQLALLTFKTSATRLEPVFYYCRALSAKYAFPVARQSVNVVFEEVRQQVEKYEKEWYTAVNSADVDRSSEPSASEESRRREVWKGGYNERARSPENSANREQQWLQSLPLQDLYKRSIFYLLNVVSMLTTKINLDKFGSTAVKGLVQLKVLLSFDASPVTAIDLVRFAAIVIFAVHSSAIRESQSNSESCSVLLQQSIQLAFSLFGLLLRQLASLWPEEQRTVDEALSLPAPAARNLPAVALLAYWLSQPTVYQLYCSVPSLDGLSSARLSLDIWAEIARFGNSLRALESAGILMISSDRPGEIGGNQTAIYLPEQLIVASFFDVFDSKPIPLNFSVADSMSDEHLARQARLCQILKMAYYWDGMSLKHFRLDKELGFVAVTGTSTSPSNVEPSAAVDRRRRRCSSDDEEQPQVERSDNSRELTDEMRRLQLGLTSERHKLQLASAESERHGGLELIVTPAFLVPDTNAMIDHLDLVDKVLKTNKYKICVPAIVAQELKGLKKGVVRDTSWAAESLRLTEHDDDDDATVEWPAKRAALALTFVEGALKSKSIPVALLTTMGVRIPDIYSEADDALGTKEMNDDKILIACENLSKREDAGPSDGSTAAVGNGGRRVERSVVLLTGDRALRIKAHARNIPVRALPDFVRWALPQSN